MRYNLIIIKRGENNDKKWFYKFLDWVGPENREAQQLKKEEGLYKNGGIIDCLRAGGNVTEGKKCGGKTLKAEDGNKIRRTDRPGYAWTLPNGIDVITQDAVGIQPLPGSNYTIEGSSPEFETHRTTLTDKGGSPIAYNYDVYINDGDHLFPSLRYTTDRIWHRPSTWFRRVLTPDAAAKK